MDFAMDFDFDQLDDQEDLLGDFDEAALFEAGAQSDELPSLRMLRMDEER